MKPPNASNFINTNKWLVVTLVLSSHTDQFLLLNRYLGRYYSDPGCDNMYIDANLEKLWLGSADREKLTPLRHWELDEKYQVSRSARISKAETRR